MRRVVAIIVALFLLLILFDRFVLIELLVRRIGIPLLFAIAGALACIGAGFLVRRGGRDVALNLLLGVPFFGTLCFLVGLLNISKWTMVPLLGVLAGIGVVSLWPHSRAGEGAVAPLPIIAIAAVGLSAFLAAQAPPASLDELAYHLAVPWTWVKEGRAIELPLNSHSYFPLGVESADLPFLTILGTSGGLASHFLHLLAAAGTTMLLFRAARRDLLIVAAIVATPALALTAGWSLVDWILLGEVIALVSALEAGDVTTVAAALAAGLLTKYTFIPIAVIAIGVHVAVEDRRPGLSRQAGAPALHCAATLLFGLTFFIRNLILTGNPVAPFLTSLAPHVAHYRLGAFLSDYIFDGRFVDESLGVSMLMTSVLAAGLLSWILIAAGVALFLLAPSARLLIPFFAIPATRALPPGRTMRVLIAIAVAAQLFLIAFFVDRTETFALLAGRQSDEQYLARARPSTLTIASLDAALPDTSRTLVIGLTETFWFQHRVRGGGNFDGPRLSNYLETPTPEALYARLKRDGITHVAVVSLPPASRVAKKIEERETDLSPGAQRALAQTLDRYASEVVSLTDATLFALR